MLLPAIFRLTGAVERDPAIERWLDAQPGELGSIGRRWFEQLRRCGADVRELMHDGLATACVADAPFAYVGVFRKHVSIGFFHGAALPDPAGQLEGTGKSMRHVKVRLGQACDAPGLGRLIASAYRDIVLRLGQADA